MKNYIKPECMPYFYNEHGNKQDKLIEQSIAYTADGYLLPCCWCDAESAKKDMIHLNMYNEQLKLSNNEFVEDILYSDVWKNFTKIITTDFYKSPRCCRERCGVINNDRSH